jgi:tetraprenyl-beta-curcumene synthase
MEPNNQLIMGGGAHEACALAAVLGRYALTTVPQARRLLRPWQARAATVPDPVLREHALATYRDEHLNAEAAAVFAQTAPRRARPAVVRLCVAFQLMYDYLDTLGEQPAADPHANGLQLHRALTAVFDDDDRAADWYALHARRDDGGYLAALVAACRRDFDALPSAAAVRPFALSAARRCGEAQSHAHAAHLDGGERLAGWAARQPGASGHRWWEIAAGGISSIGVHALFAAAADPRTSPAVAARVDAAYFPSACALSTLLDSLVDREHDAGQHGFATIACYPSSVVAAERCGAITAESAVALRRLPGAPRHMALLRGVAGYYLSDRGASTAWAAPVSAAIARQLGPLIVPTRASLRLRRRLGG